jgi:MFS family permease
MGISTIRQSSKSHQLTSLQAAAIGSNILMAFISDFFHHRFLFILIPIGVAIAGFTILITTHYNHHLEYGALFLVTTGIFSAMPIIICWFTMNLGGHHRRAVGSAWQIGFGNIGGIIATFSFLTGDAKTFYHKGYSICLGFICLSAASCVCYLLAGMSQNHNKGKSIDVGMTEYEKVEMGDLSPDYRYML